MVPVVLTAEAAEQLEQLENPIHGRVLKLLVRLEKWPEVSGAKPLRGDLAGQRGNCGKDWASRRIL